MSYAFGGDKKTVQKEFRVSTEVLKDF